MSFWIEPLWIAGAPATAGTRRILDTVDLMEPMFTTVQRVLATELDADVQVWADLVLGDVGPNDKNVVVRNAGAEDINTTSVNQQRKRFLEIHCYASNADATERLMRDVRIVMKKSDLIPVSTMMELDGDYNEDIGVYKRAMQFSLRTKL